MPGGILVSFQKKKIINSVSLCYSCIKKLITFSSSVNKTNRLDASLFVDLATIIRSIGKISFLSRPRDFAVLYNLYSVLLSSAMSELIVSLLNIMSYK